MLKRTCLLSLGLIVFGSGCTAELRYKDRVLAGLVRQVPGLLANYDASSGRFGTGIWICRPDRDWALNWTRMPWPRSWATTGRTARSLTRSTARSWIGSEWVCRQELARKDI